MLVSSVSSVKSNSVIPSSVGSARANASNPSFGIYYKPRTGRLVREYLPEHERYFFAQMMEYAIIEAGDDSIKAQINTDRVCSKAVGRALELRSWKRLLRSGPIPMPISLDFFSWVNKTA